MNRKKYITLTLMLSLLCMNKTYAACTQEEINEFKKVEDEFKITYEFDKTTKDYKITMYNPDFSKYGYVFDNNLNINENKYHSSTDSSLTFDQIKPGEYTLGVIMTSETCQDSLKTIKINLPKYNRLSEDLLCDGIEEFVLCQPTYDKEIDYDTFVSRINTYKRTKSEKETEQMEMTEENKTIENILEYVKKNILEIIIVIVFIVLVTITIALTAKSIKKSRRLE